MAKKQSGSTKGLEQLKKDLKQKSPANLCLLRSFSGLKEWNIQKRLWIYYIL